MFYVPGLRPIFQKQARRARGQATARRRVELERTQALPYASYPGLVSQRGSKEEIYSGYNAFTTSRNSREHGISGQLGPAAATGSTVTATGDEVTQSYAEVEASRCAHGRDSIPLQQSSQSPDNAADTYFPLMSPSPNDDSVLLVSLVSDSMAGQDKIPQQGSQKSGPPHLESRRPPSKLSPSKVQNRPRATLMSSAPARNPPDIGIESNKLVPLLPNHALPSSASRKSILKKRPSSTSLPPQAWLLRKSVRFSFDARVDCPAAEATPDVVKPPIRLPSPPPPPIKTISPMPRRVQQLWSSTRLASLQLMEVRASPSSTSHTRGGTDSAGQQCETSEAKAHSKPGHRALIAENLAAFFGGSQIDGRQEVEDHTASNTDFALAERMRRRWS